MIWKSKTIKFEENPELSEEIQIEDPQPDLIANEIEYNQTDAQTCEDSIYQQNNIKHKNKNMNKNNYLK